MNKTAIKNFAIWARNDLIKRVGLKASEYGITENSITDENADSVNNHLLSAGEKDKRKTLIAHVKNEGYKTVIEEVAYTWFNRFIALRYMEVNGFLPNHIRIFTDENNNFKPQILTEAIHLELEGLDKKIVLELKEKNKDEELYKYLLITQCNALNNKLPKMFLKIEEYKELLFPDNLLREGSVLEQMVTKIPEEDWQDQVQIIGWMYQYWNTEPKKTAMEGKSYEKEDFAAVTQLFTPEWIVRYMVENSLGRIWAETHSDFDPTVWKYYLAESEENKRKLAATLTKTELEELTFLDPCMGSGHILVYAFDVFMQLYRSAGWNDREAVASIVQKNIFGVDLDKRAWQLSYFALKMKACQYDKRFLTRGIEPNVFYMQELSLPVGCELSAETKKFVEQFKNADVYGSLTSLVAANDVVRLEIESFKDSLLSQGAKEILQRMVETADVVSNKYSVVVTNPPYMNPSTNIILKDFVQDYYPDSKGDLCAVFIEKCACFAKEIYAMITMHSWMFLSSFEKFRKKLQKNTTIVNMIHLGTRAFDEIGGEVVQTTSFVMLKSPVAGYKGIYCRLIEPTTQQGKEDMFLAAENHYITQQSNFSKIPGSPVAYWVSDSLYKLFDGDSIGNHYDVKAGMCTGKNEVFIMQWHEFDFTKSSLITDNYLYTPHNKGGEFRKWYGNRDVFLKYNKKALTEMEDNAGFRHDGREYYFMPHIGWSKITSSKSSFRFFEDGFTFDSAGLGLFSKNVNMLCTLALLNSKVVEYLIPILNPTLNVTPMIVKKLPYTDIDVTMIVQECISASKSDWDSFEISWDFKQHPLLNYGVSIYSGLGDGKNPPTSPIKIDKDETHFKIYEEDKPRAYTIKSTFEMWESACNDRFNHLKSNEEELNRIFIDIYGLQDELTPEVEDNDVTVRKADLTRDIKSLISYAVGCMFGRYSLDIDGLAYAGGQWDAGKYIIYPADKDNIIPICDDEYFEDDIVGRFVKFVEVVYGSKTLEENLMFISNAIGGQGRAPRSVIRSYFLNDFYKDHLKTYQKRPIYWLFDAGKKNSFKALIYMHRYQKETLAKIRTDYIHEQQGKYRANLIELTDKASTAGTSERIKLEKQISKFRAQDEELHNYEEKVHHLADQMIEIDLDDGVKHNYEIFKDVLAPLK